MTCTRRVDIDHYTILFNCDTLCKCIFLYQSDVCYHLYGGNLYIGSPLGLKSIHFNCYKQGKNVVTSAIARLNAEELYPKLLLIQEHLIPDIVRYIIDFTISDI